MVHPRARQAGVRGFYIPEMALRHIIPAEPAEQGRTSAAGSTGAASAVRCSTSGPASTWKRPSRPRSTSRRVPHVLGVPRYLYRKALPRARRLGPRHAPRPPHRRLRARAVALFLRRHRPPAFSRFARAAGRRLPASPRERDRRAFTPGANTGAPAITPGTTPQVDATDPDLHLQPRGVPRAHARQPRGDAGRSRVLLERPRRRQQLERRHPRRRRVARRTASRCRCTICSKDARESRTR